MRTWSEDDHVWGSKASLDTKSVCTFSLDLLVSRTIIKFCCLQTIQSMVFCYSNLNWFKAMTLKLDLYCFLMTRLMVCIPDKNTTVMMLCHLIISLSRVFLFTWSNWYLPCFSTKRNIFPLYLDQYFAGGNYVIHQYPVPLALVSTENSCLYLP